MNRNLKGEKTMKKEYMKPEATIITFDYSENVTASRTYTTTDQTTQWWECHTRYEFNDSVEVCGQDGHDVTHAYWLCDVK
jgi:hypothetical protein